MENKLQTTATAGAVSVFSGNMPDLSKATAAPLELSGEYWTPEREGETRRMFFKELRMEQSINPEMGETIDLPVVCFVDNSTGALRLVRNASRRLVGVFEMQAASIKEGDPFEITYLGKVKNKNNAFRSDNWSVKPLAIQ